MKPGPVLRAVTVNHGTSMFAELMLRSLFRRNDLGALDFGVTVLDNRSADAHLPELEAYLAAAGIPLVQTGFDASNRVEKHGEALAAFVREHDDCTHYLFLDSDMFFVEEDAVGTMLREIEEDAKLFAVQARIFGVYAKRVIEGKGGRVDAWDLEDRDIGCRIRVEGNPEESYALRFRHRASPVCSLVRNIPEFRRVVEAVGLTPALLLKSVGGTGYDTFGLMTHIMETHGFVHRVSSKTVHHFTETANRPEFRGARDADCARMLQQLRAGPATFRGRPV